jgi:hypothetical protein
MSEETQVRILSWIVGFLCGLCALFLATEILPDWLDERRQRARERAKLDKAQRTNAMTQKPESDLPLPPKYAWVTSNGVAQLSEAFDRLNRAAKDYVDGLAEKGAPQLAVQELSDARKAMETAMAAFLDGVRPAVHYSEGR